MEALKLRRSAFFTAFFGLFLKRSGLSLHSSNLKEKKLLHFLLLSLTRLLLKNLTEPLRLFLNLLKKKPKPFRCFFTSFFFFFCKIKLKTPRDTLRVVFLIVLKRCGFLFFKTLFSFFFIRHKRSSTLSRSAFSFMR
jgi:hypothetical protein